LQSGEIDMQVLWLIKAIALEVFESNISKLTTDLYVQHFNCSTQLAAFKKYLETE
jgi:hypothetical protein